MKEKRGQKFGDRFNSMRTGLLLRQRRIAMTIGGFMVVALALLAGCGKTNSGAGVLQRAPYVIALSQPAGSVPGSLYALSPTQGSVQKLGLNVGQLPNSMLLDGHTLYVVNAGDATLSVVGINESASTISMKNEQLIQLPSTSYPEYITITTVNGEQKGFVSLNGTNQVAVLNLSNSPVLKNIISIPPYSTWTSVFQTHPWGISMVNGKVMVANNGANYAAYTYTYTTPAMVSVIDQSADSLLTPITTTTGINLQAVEPTQTGFVVISSGNYGAIGGYAELFDNAFAEKTVIPLSGGGAGIAVSSTGIGYVALSSVVGYDEINTNTGEFITTTDLTAQVKGLTGFNLTSIKFAPDGTLWATDWQDNMVFEINPATNTVIKTFKLPEPAQDVVFVY